MSIDTERDSMCSPQNEKRLHRWLIVLLRNSHGQAQHSEFIVAEQCPYLPYSTLDRVRSARPGSIIINVSYLGHMNREEWAS